MMNKLIILFFALIFSVSVFGSEKFEVDVHQVVGANHRFWQTAGHEMLWWSSTRPAGQHLLNRTSRYQSIRYLRAHATFSNKKNGGEVIRWSADKKNYQYDFLAKLIQCLNCT